MPPKSSVRVADGLVEGNRSAHGARRNLVPVTHSGLPPVAAATGRERKEKVATRLLEKVIRRLELRERSVAEINTVDGEKSGSAVVFGRRELKESGMQEIRS